jgi:methionine-gamma-lyase
MKPRKSPRKGREQRPTRRQESGQTLPPAAAHAVHPESLMMSLGYDPQSAMGAIKPPVFASSTYVFPDAETGKARFAAAHGEPAEPGTEGLIYARLSHPGMELAEQRLAVWDGAEGSALFHSGMSAISTAMLAYLKPGDALLFSGPLYGGTDHLIRHVLTGMGIRVMEFRSGQTESEVVASAQAAGLDGLVRMVFVETPGNPTNDLIDLVLCRRLADRLGQPGQPALLAVDNTFLGPMWQRPLEHGADLVLYSATKYLGGHSDLVAGAVSGSEAALAPVRALRVYLGSGAGPWESWMLLRSLETLAVRTRRQAETAAVVARYLARHPLVSQVRWLGFLSEDDGAAHRVYRQQCLGPGAMISFYLKGGEEEAFRFLNSLQLIRLAVSLGGTESLAEHPAAMTHYGLDPQLKEQLGIAPNLVRLSVGLEHPDDLIADLDRGFAALRPAQRKAGASRRTQSNWATKSSTPMPSASAL